MWKLNTGCSPKYVRENILRPIEVTERLNRRNLNDTESATNCMQTFLLIYP